MLETELGGTRNKIFAMTPEIGSSFWPAAATIEDLCKEMMYHNLTAAQMVNNYATLKDITTSNFISSSSYSTSYEIQRLGIGGQGDFEVSFTPISDNITSGTNTNNHNQMNLGGTIEDDFTIELSSEIQDGDQVSYKLVLNNGFFNKEYLINKIYGNPTIVFEDESSMIQDYWESNSWNITYEDYTSPDTSITDSPNGNYSNNEYSVIELSNSINLSDASYAELSFNTKWHTESGYDYVQVEISVDNGQNWTPQCGKYTKIGTNNHENATDEPLYDGLQESWVNETISLSDYLDNEILIRFKLVSDNSQRRDGFYFDDLKVNVLSNNLDLSSIELNNISVYPNPVTDRFYINTNLINYNISIYNILGKQIYRTIGNSGNTTINLSLLPRGVFLLKLNNEKRIKTFKIIKN